MFALRVRDVHGKTHSLSAPSATLAALTRTVQPIAGTPHFAIKAGFPPVLLASDAAVLEALTRREPLLVVACDAPTTDTDALLVAGSLRRLVVPADGNCLFSSLQRLLDLSVSARDVIADAVAASDRFDEALLGRAKAEYVVWLRQDCQWGGEIECAVAAEVFQVRIVVLHVGGTILRYGGECEMQIHLLYDGAHFDPLLVNERPLVPVADAGDVEADMHELAAKLMCVGAFTDVATDQLQCSACRARFAGEKQAQAHAQQTGHVNFVIANV